MNEIESYIDQIDAKRKEAYIKLYEVIQEQLPIGFEPVLQYGMPTFVVPLNTYPKGYLNRTDEPLPFISIGVQKNHIALYHMGLYGMEELKEWFEREYAKRVPTKLNMGKSCIRFTNTKTIPYDLIGELSEKVTVKEWINKYETGYRNSK
ncbi:MULTISPECIES: DUF1801 domain-containing protein [Mammaliicoccus]|uniref:DUF1801 domain-containing protein n=1 Tax=Mammaliicoccus fleurettii TaxID=150056 RepID=A0ABS5MN10_9STAP|nr:MULTISPECIES: DUF1801 domain-containing protein [Mammaliicoccus]MBL0847605.1 DUF1801 domain-containing protein [Mammaliicoccus fleurettii]MBS3673104.1 DUF1801 domain-containing protein [Mammaliicoccus fleurettii]MBS3697291.1 DUF1801 domain-containing protein [Mammaliicoccus fleurettii]MBW0765817.1 DUF1801 domain-containing protein [Mammaliicoccus fleurettii]MEB6201463.1 DUF1801 domain-containing protein [Mammaliicoccus fleurettii]